MRLRDRRPPPLRWLIAAGVLFSAPATAEEPLFLRIRPIPEPDSAGAGQAAREALWARSDARARTAIASICTGCLGPRPAAMRDGRLATLGPSKGLEPDPVPGASDTMTDRPVREERP